METPRRCTKCLGTGSNRVNYGIGSGGTNIPYNTGNCTQCGGTGWMNYNAMLSQMTEESNANNGSSDMTGGPGGIGFLIPPGIVAVILFIAYHFHS